MKIGFYFKLEDCTVVAMSSIKVDIRITKVVRRNTNQKVKAKTLTKNLENDECEICEF